MSYNTYPQNPFPPNSENAGGGGSSYELPIASPIELGGIMTGDGLFTDPTSGTTDVKIQGGGGLLFDQNKQLYVDFSKTDKNTWNINNANQTRIGQVTIGQNTYPLYRACFNPPYQMWIQANQDVANFLNPTQVPYPIDNRCINFYIFDTNNRNITEMAVIERSTGGFMRILKSFNTDTIQIGKFMVEYYDTSSN